MMLKEKKHKNPDRKLDWYKLPKGAIGVTVTEPRPKGDKITMYRVERVEAGFRFTKLATNKPRAEEKDGIFGSYVVNLNNEDTEKCQCDGCKYGWKCIHIEILLKLMERGAL